MYRHVHLIHFYHRATPSLKTASIAAEKGVPPEVLIAFSLESKAPKPGDGYLKVVAALCALLDPSRGQLLLTQFRMMD